MVQLMIDWSNDNITNKINFLSELRMLNAIAHLYADNQWEHTLDTRRVICTQAEIQPSTFKKNLSLLVDKGLLIKVDRGIYKINSEILS